MEDEELDQYTLLTHAVALVHIFWGHGYHYEWDAISAKWHLRAT